MLPAVLLIFFVAGALSDYSLKPGQCPHYPGQKDFDITIAKGDWYLLKISRLHGMEIRCLINTVRHIPERTILEYSRYYIVGSPVQRFQNNTYTQDCKKLYFFEQTAFFPKEILIPREAAIVKDITTYIIVSDNKSYVTFVTCINLRNDHYLPTAFIFSKTPYLDEKFIEQSRKAFNKVGVDDDLQDVEQTSCASRDSDSEEDSDEDD